MGAASRPRPRAWTARWRLTLGAGLLAAALLLGIGGSLVHTEVLRAAFRRQVWQGARYPSARLLGAVEQFGRIVDARGSWHHCDFAALGVYGTDDEFEAVESYYAAHTISVDGEAPAAASVTPVSDLALAGTPLRPGSSDEQVREALVRARVDRFRAQTFATVYVVEAVSWGHAAWLDWRCW